LLRPLPYPQAERLAAVWLHSPAIGIFRDWPSPGQFIDLQNENHSFEEMALAQTRMLTLTGREQPERVAGIRTQSSLLKMLGAKTLLGRVLLPEEDKPGKPAVAATQRPGEFKGKGVVPARAAGKAVEATPSAGGNVQPEPKEKPSAVEKPAKPEGAPNAPKIEEKPPAAEKLVKPEPAPNAPKVEQKPPAVEKLMKPGAAPNAPRFEERPPAPVRPETTPSAPRFEARPPVSQAPLRPAEPSRPPGPERKPPQPERKIECGRPGLPTCPR